MGSEEEGVDRDSIDRIRSATFPVRILTEAHDAGEQLQAEAEREARRIVEEARAEAQRIVDEANQRRAEIEAVI